MLNKFSALFVSSLAVILIITLYGGNVFGQTTATSPYSSYGFGQRDGVDHAVYAGIGTTTITYFDSTTLNFNNPASYNTMAKGQPLFSVGVSSRLSFYNEGDVHNFSKAILLNHYAMGLSFGKHFGLAFGIKPFTRKGYEFSTKQLLVTDSVLHQYSGGGNTSEVFLGLSSNLFKFKNQQLAIGGNVGYVFGTLTNERKSNIVGANNGGIDQNILKINAFHYELGVYYKQRFNQKHSYTLSAVIEPQQKMIAHEQWSLFTSSFVNNPNYYVKVDSTSLIQGNLLLAPSTTLGLNYTYTFTDEKGERLTRHSEISLHTSYNMTNWSLYRTNFGNVEDNPGFANTSKLTVGIQYIPEISFYGQSNKSNFFEIMRYRIGAYNYSLPLVLDGKALTDKGASLGFGIPIGNQRSLSSVNFGFTMGQRGNGVTGSLQEKYYGINLGIIFAPASFERWFIKRKYD